MRNHIRGHRRLFKLHEVYENNFNITFIKRFSTANKTPYILLKTFRLKFTVQILK